MIHFNCPNCNRKLKILEDAAGKTGRCPKCGKPVETPSLPPPMPEASTVEDRRNQVPASEAMSIQIQCPNCQNRARVADKDAGKRFKCPNCGGEIAGPPQDSAAVGNRPVSERRVAAMRIIVPIPEKSNRKSHWFAARKAPKERAQGSQQKRQPYTQQQQDADINQLRMSPLMHHHLCTICAWVGHVGAFQHQGSIATTAGSAVAAGGVAASGLGIGGMILGIILIIVGIPLLFFFFLGVIPIVIGFILLFMGGTATTAGSIAAAAGVTTAAQASDAKRAAAQAPPQCPMCKNVGLIPALSPLAQKMIQENPNLAAMARSESERVIQSLPDPPLIITAEMVFEEENTRTDATPKTDQ